MNLVKRRNFLLGGGAWVGGALIARAVAERRAKTISIFHTTDLHGHILPSQTYEGVGDVGGLARCASQIREWRQRCPDSLLVDIGDVYQGTPVGLASDGRIMIDLFNRLGYDAWTIGNHDFDWGPEVLEGSLELSKCPVLCGNIKLGGKNVGQTGGEGELGGAWKKVQPWVLREVGGFRIGLVGLTTPGLPYWLAPETLGGVAVFDPAKALKSSIADLQAEGADAIVVMGHMGWRWKEDYANPVQTMLEEVDGVDIYLAGHSHQNQPLWMQGKTMCSQASYYGIHCGRVDLTFDLESRRLIDRKLWTVRMDGRFQLDPGVMEIAEPELKKAKQQMARKVCVVKEKISMSLGNPSLRGIFCEAFSAALKRQGMKVEGVFHGTFGSGAVEPGPKTVADCWKWLPYENLLVTAELEAGDLIKILEEDAENSSSNRVLWPFEVLRGGSGKISELRLNGKALKAGKRYRIGMNSYDAQSGGQRMMVLRKIMLDPASKRKMSGVSTRAALIDYLLEKGSI